MTTSYTLEGAFQTSNGWDSAPVHAYHYITKALADKLAARMGGDRSDVVVLAHGLPVTPAQAAAHADHWSHVALWQAISGADDLPF